RLCPPLARSRKGGVEVRESGSRVPAQRSCARVDGAPFWGAPKGPTFYWPTLPLSNGRCRAVRIPRPPRQQARSRRPAKTRTAPSARTSRQAMCARESLAVGRALLRFSGLVLDGAEHLGSVCQVGATGREPVLLEDVRYERHRFLTREASRVVLRH